MTLLTHKYWADRALELLELREARHSMGTVGMKEPVLETDSF